MMLKIGIELPDENISDVDFGNPELGNPGVGGSEYLFALLAKFLSMEGFCVIVYHYSKNKLADGVRDCIVSDNIAMIQKAAQDETDILIHQVGKTEKWYQLLSDTAIKAIAWAHVYPQYEELKMMDACPNVQRVVFVGKEEYDAYIDNDIIKKATYIFNMIPTSIEARPRICTKPVVTYVGSLVPAKGFHKLARVWSKVLAQVPDAELNIIGNGRVYNRGAKLGKYGIAQEDYEEIFMKYLIDDSGSILPSVHFLGLVGTEKTEIFCNTAIGIVNPTALTETFCMSAIEMEYAYVPVISKKKWGLLDTVQDGETGFLFSNKKEFVERIVTLLMDSNLNAKMGEKAHKYVVEKFSTKVIIPQWISLIYNVANDMPAAYQGAQDNWGNDNKWMKEVIRVIRYDLHISAFPTYEDIKQIGRRVKRMIAKCTE